MVTVAWIQKHRYVIGGIVAIVIFGSVLGGLYVSQTETLAPEQQAEQSAENGHTESTKSAENSPYAFEALWGEKKEYSDSELGISFLYPVAWGEVIKAEDNSCTDKTKLGCNNISYTFSKKNEAPFLYAWGKNSEIQARGGFWGDAARFVASEQELKSYCGKSSTYDGGCSLYRNKNGVSVVRDLGRSYEMGDDLNLVYIIYPGNPNLNGGIILSPDRLYGGEIGQARMDDETFKGIIDSIKIIPRR